MIARQPHALHPLGAHRVIEPAGALPQDAWRLDNTPVARRQRDPVRGRSAQHRLGFVPADRAKRATSMRSRIGEHDHCERSRARQAAQSRHRQRRHVRRPRAARSAKRCAMRSIRVGDRIASLVSLTLTPLRIDAMTGVDVATGRVWMRGKAILFESGLCARLARGHRRRRRARGARRRRARRRKCGDSHAGQTVVVIGADGKSGLLACAQAKARVGASGRVIGIGPDADTAGARLLRARAWSTSSSSPTRATPLASSARSRSRPRRSSPTS